MKRLIEIADLRRFWVGVFISVLLILSLINGINNHRQAVRNAALIREHNQLLSYFCELAAVQDAIYIQLIPLERAAVGDPSLSPAQRQRALTRLNLYLVAHQEASQTRGCRKIE